MRLQLWSYNYEPEPQGIAPMSTMLARGLAARGNDVTVVAAHPHYPEPAWGVRVRPYRERRDGIPVLRLPLWAGRDSGVARIRQELSFLAAQTAVAPLLPRPDALVAVTPSFPALAAAMGFARARRVPLVIWLQDILPDGAVTTGLLKPGRLLDALFAFERAAYDTADRVVVISEAFRRNLLDKGVSDPKLERIFNPSSRQPETAIDVDALATAPPKVLAMGNIGHTQGLDRIVDAFQADPRLAAFDARLVIAGHGVAADEVRARITAPRVSMPGVLYGAELEPELRSASLGLVSQRADVLEFNLPSKLMTYMAYGIPVLASVRPDSETANIVRESGAGWVTNAAEPAQFAERAAAVIRDTDALRSASAAGFAYAREHFTPRAVAKQFEQVLRGVAGHGGRQRVSRGRGVAPRSAVRPSRK